MRALGLTPGPRVTPIVKFELVKDEPALRAHLEALASDPDLERLIVSHEKWSSGRQAAVDLRRAASTLSGGATS
jgi:hypothetical protein